MHQTAGSGNTVLIIVCAAGVIAGVYALFSPRSTAPRRVAAVILIALAGVFLAGALK